MFDQGKPSSPGGFLTRSRLSPPFLPGEEREALEAAALPIRACGAHLDLVREGDTVEQIYVVIEGWACRYKTARDGSRQIVALIVPGDVANLDCLIMQRPDFGVRSLTPIRVAALPSNRVLALAERNAATGKMLLHLALAENAIVSQWAFCLGRKPAQQRLAHLLCELAERHAGNKAGAVTFYLPLTQEQLADVLGLTAVHVNRTMQQLRGERLIVTTGRTITIPDIERLRDRAEFDAAYLHIEAPLAGTGSHRSNSRCAV